MLEGLWGQGSGEMWYYEDLPSTGAGLRGWWRVFPLLQGWLISIADSTGIQANERSHTEFSSAN